MRNPSALLNIRPARHQATQGRGASRGRAALRGGVLCLLAATGTVAGSLRAQRVDDGLARLESEIVRLAAISGGKVGAGIIHLETGRELYVNGDEAFPMASTYKVPIAVQLLTRVDSGTLRLDSMIALKGSDLHPGSGTLSNLLDDPGVVLSVRNLLELMLLISDNSATDIMLRTAGGSGAVNARLATLGVTGISVDRPTDELIADAIGVKDLPSREERSLAKFRALAAAVSDSAQRIAARVFYDDRRDTATPRGMAKLLQTVWQRKALGGANSDLLLDIMLRCETGPNRIKGLLPPGTRVMHKTGTLSIGVANDVGIIELPDKAGHVVVALFVKESRRDAATQERAIAQIARSAYDYFLFR
ncbi:MAG: class A beta-lactamase [Gemmatimonadaceae bacterium]